MPKTKATPTMTMTDTARVPVRSGASLRSTERVIAWVLPSLADVLFVLCLLGIVMVLQGRVLGMDGDIGWHIRLGLRTLSGDLPRTDTFSSTAYGRPLVGMEWLAEVCYAAVWRLGGLNAVVALAGILVGATGAGLLLVLRARRVPMLLALPLALLALALTSIHWSARPHLFSFVLTLWWSEWLWRYWRDGERRRLWYFPAVMLLWVNLHGGFLAGLILLGTAVVVAWLFPRSRGRAFPQHLTLAFAACLLATAVTPWGPAWAPYFASYFTDPLVSAYTQELQSPDFHTLSARIFLALVLLLAAAWIFIGRSTRPSGQSSAEPRSRNSIADTGAPDPLAWATAAVWTVLAFTAIRAVPLWALVVTPILGEALTRWLRELAGDDLPHAPQRVARLARIALARSAAFEATESRMGRGVWSGVAVALVGVLVLSGGAMPGARQPVVNVQFSSRDFPVEAVARLRRDGLPVGRGFNTVEWGGYLTYALPGYHVFIDSRSDFYGQTLLRDYLTVIDVAPGWQAALDKYHVRWALIPSATPLASVLAISPGWLCERMDQRDVAVLCVRAAASGP